LPIYEYECACGHRKETIGPYGAPAPKHCSTVMAKRISAPGQFIFKGSGFYATEYGEQMSNLSPDAQQARLNRELVNRKMSPIKTRYG